MQAFSLSLSLPLIFFRLLSQQLTFVHSGDSGGAKNIEKAGRKTTRSDISASE